MSDDGTIYIESTRDPEGGTNAMCLIRWGATEKYAPVADVRKTAEDLMTCAAYADLVGELLRAGLEGYMVTGMVSGILAHRKLRYLGAPSTLFLLVGGSTASKEGRVLLGRRNLFHQGKADEVIEPDNAREMARAWMAMAEASEADSLFSAVLDRSGLLKPVETTALFDLMMDIRTGKAELPPRRE